MSAFTVELKNRPVQRPRPMQQPHPPIVIGRHIRVTGRHHAIPYFSVPTTPCDQDVNGAKVCTVGTGALDCTVLKPQPRR
jgi:hypothetical protein